eukprot:6199389-Pleurochrysis_carterae.AAC.3
MRKYPSLASRLFCWAVGPVLGFARMRPRASFDVARGLRLGAVEDRGALDRALELLESECHALRASEAKGLALSKPRVVQAMRSQVRQGVR